MSDEQSDQDHSSQDQNNQIDQKNVQEKQSVGDKKKELQQKFKLESEASKKKFMPLVKFALKHKLKIKTAKNGNSTIEYFRTNQMQQLLEQNKQKVQKDQELKLLAKQWKYNVIYFRRYENDPKLRYPKQLQKTYGNQKDKFASFKFDTVEPKKWLLPVILIAVIAGVLFPLWPYSLKYSIFLVCLYLLILVVTIIVLRLVLYILFAIFGVSFWLFPNYFADCTILESFMPLFSLRRWDSGMFSIIGRLLSFLIIGYYSYHLYIDPSWVFENLNITRTSIDDLHDWGVSKIKGEKNFSQSALTNLKDIMNQTEVNDVDGAVNLDGDLINDKQNQNHQQRQSREQQFKHQQQV